MDVQDAMNQIALKLDTIGGLRVFSYTPANVPVPCAIVGLPTNTTYHMTYGRKDRLQLPIVVLVGSVNDRTAQENLAAHLSGEGSKSIRQTIDGATWNNNIAVRVESASVAWLTIASVDYISATFIVDIGG